jgi:hypothetical protein
MIVKRDSTLVFIELTIYWESHLSRDSKYKLGSVTRNLWFDESLLTIGELSLSEVILPW